MKAKAQKIGDGVYWIGVLDWDLRSYHGYTLDGTTYNAYIVFGEKVAIIDNAYPGKTEEMMARIEDAFEQEGREMKVDYIVQNHVEKDHSGVLYDLWKKFDAPIYCSKIAQGGLLRHYPKLEGADFNIVGTGDALDLGGKTLAFLDAFLLHWPDSMFTLLAEDGILFPNDAFGQHLCFAKRFDTDIPEVVLMDAAQKFYGNLITPLSKKVLNKFDEIIELGLLEQVKMIAPSHGQIWTDPMKIIGAYSDWATGKRAEDKVTIVYDTMHYSTQKMAHEVAEGIIAEGYDVEMYFLHEDERSEIVKSILTSKAVAFGIPTINDFPFPSIGDIIYYLKGLHFNRTGFKRPAVTFGSMGGRGGAVEFIANELTECGFEVLDQQEIYYVPDGEDDDTSFKLGQKLVEEAKKLEL
ncbi:MAG: FprA family A-type flavoprotein [Methanobrevibacter ruminantium]|jgi:flavorubredoxin|uniref:FprA family A-type flavoprotein n=1 Tax=Methanobrevibacter ruminantium TaxID=83816 RepID=UPI0026E9D498|nr:FprA family A-type flavoprotein [Methanobrevibacter ruminantium]MCI5736707.1 FprA family A-type flavoprotein [Methanobrevibacter ruminantium]MDD6048901.1 FprA family A-type flavoprotein [Methanobrevibacter ruminantium]MDO5842021.1 FprA family A-type flavoprotein [Methanobrevibacter ruminantium]